jgi:hypothetical protein
MVLYHENRIEVDYIPNLRASFKAYDAARTRNDIATSSSTSSSDVHLSTLRDLLFNRKRDTISRSEKYGRLIVAGYDLRRTKGVERMLYSSTGATSKSKSLWINICLFSRLRVAFQCFKDIALALPSFTQVSITLVPYIPVVMNPSQRSLDLDQTFSVLGLKPTHITTEAVLGKSWTLEKTKREFVKRQKQKPNIHAEVQMLMFFGVLKSSNSNRFPYFGCSKLSCFMCNHFLQFFGRVTTRGSHGRLFRPWTVPNVNGLQSGEAKKTAKALISVQKKIQETLKASVEVNIRHQRTSVVGGVSSVSGRRQEQQSQRQLQIDRQFIEAERDRVSALLQR